MVKEFDKKIAYIEHEIRNAGYDPYVQLNAYINTQDDRYITRKGNARQMILELDLEQVSRYVRQMN